MTSSTPTLSAPVLLVCLCAEWCGVCRDYRARFERLRESYPLMQIVWMDVEDEADLLHPLDVEDFPTLLLAVGDEPRFFGPVTPQADTVERLLRSHTQERGAPALTDPKLTALVARIRAAHPQ